MNLITTLKHPLKLGDVRLTDEGDQVEAWYFEHNTFSIWDPYISTCGRFEVDPRVEYDMSLVEAANLANLNGIGVPPEYLP